MSIRVIYALAICLAITGVAVAADRILIVNPTEETVEFFVKPTNSKADYERRPVRPGERISVPYSRDQRYHVAIRDSRGFLFTRSNYDLHRLNQQVRSSDVKLSTLFTKRGYYHPIQGVRVENNLIYSKVVRYEYLPLVEREEIPFRVAHEDGELLLLVNPPSSDSLILVAPIAPTSPARAP